LFWIDLFSRQNTWLAELVGWFWVSDKDAVKYEGGFVDNGK